MLVGGVAPGEGNVIAFSGIVGVVMLGIGAAGNTIRGNSIYANGGLGIDLESDGVDPNDAGDTDTGPNGIQNFPLDALRRAAGPDRRHPRPGNPRQRALDDVHARLLLEPALHSPARATSSRVRSTSEPRT